MAALTGVFQAGTPTIPYTHKATIRLRGSRSTPSFSNSGLGSKFIAVLGNLFLFGNALDYDGGYTTLKATLEKGGQSILVPATSAGNYQ